MRSAPPRRWWASNGRRSPGLPHERVAGLLRPAVCRVSGEHLRRGGLPRGARAARVREPAHRRRRRVGRRARARRGARARRPAARLARPAARRPVHRQGSQRRDALPDDLRLARVRRQRAGRRRRLHRAPAARRRGADRQDEHARDGHAADDREPALRRHAQPARHDAHARRLERRRGGGARGGHRPLAQGSDGGGSIRIPAACCGVVGHKPTRGLVSGAPASYDSWEGFATNGPMARTVADCALMLEVMAGPEPGDTYAPPPHDGAFVAACAEDPGPLRIGVLARSAVGRPRRRGGDDLRAALELLAHMGHQLEEAEAPLAALMEPFHTIVLGQTPRCGRCCRPSASSCSSPRRARRSPTASASASASTCRRSRRRGAARPRCSRRWRRSSSSSARCSPGRRCLSDEFPLDAPRRELGARTTTGTPTPCRSTSPASPPSRSHRHDRGGLPVGLQIAGPPGADARVLALGAALERALA